MPRNNIDIFEPKTEYGEDSLDFSYFPDITQEAQQETSHANMANTAMQQRISANRIKIDVGVRSADDAVKQISHSFTIGISTFVSLILIFILYYFLSFGFTIPYFIVWFTSLIGFIFSIGAFAYGIKDIHHKQYVGAGIFFSLLSTLMLVGFIAISFFFKV